MKQTVRNRTGARSGQAMLIAVLSLGGAILGATTVAGLLTLYQIRATTDAANSARAIFAADGGIEWAQFDHYCSTDTTPSGGNRCPAASDYTLPTFQGSKAAITVSCYSDYSAQGTATTTCSDPGVLSVISGGVANGSERAFYISFSTSSPYYP